MSETVYRLRSSDRGTVLPLAALVFAPLTEEDTPIVHRVFIAGQDILDYQVRAAHQAGAQHILVFAERLTAHILATSDRLARDDIKIEIVRTPEEAADHLHPDELTLVVAANVIAAPQVYRLLMQADKARVLGLRDMEGLESLERIDGFTRWSGLALMSGTLIRQTARTVGEWDYARTLLRQALQSGVELEVDDPRHADAPLIAIVHDQAKATAVNNAFLMRNPAATAGLIEHYLWAPLVSALVPPLLRAGVQPDIWVAALGLSVLLTLASIWLTPFMVPLLLFLATGVAAQVAQRLLQISLRKMDRLDIILAGRLVVGGLALLGEATQLVNYGFGWGSYILTLWLLIEMARLALFDPWLLGKRSLPVWRASPDAVALSLVVGHLLNRDLLALELILAYAIVTNTILLVRSRS